MRAALHTAEHRRHPGWRRPPSRVSGFTFAEDRRCSAQDACILFDPQVDPSVLVVQASPAAADDADFDLSRFSAKAITVVRRPNLERVLISDGLDRLSVEVRCGSLATGPVYLDLVVPRLRHTGLVCPSLEHLLASARTGVVAHRPLLNGDRRSRWCSSMLAWDARASGASQRDIGVLLFGRERVESDWNQFSDSLRSHVRRLLAHADQMISGGWRDMLRTR